MPDVKIYIRTEDWNKWLTIEKKSQFIHEAINSVLPLQQTKVADNPRVTFTSVGDVPAVEEVLIPRPLDEVLAEKENDPYKDLVISRSMDMVINKITGEREDADPEMVAELKRLGRVVS